MYRGKGEAKEGAGKVYLRWEMRPKKKGSLDTYDLQDNENSQEKGKKCHGLIYIWEKSLWLLNGKRAKEEKGWKQVTIKEDQ